MLAGLCVSLLIHALWALTGLVETFVTFAFAFTPLVFVPFAANLAARDRATGLAKVQATMPTAPAATIAAKLATALAVLAAYLAACVLVGTGLLWPLLAAPWTHFGTSLAWGGLVGVWAIVVGLLLGTVITGPPRTAVATGFLVAVFAALLGGNAENLLTLAPAGFAGSVVEFVLDLSPLTWYQLTDSSAFVPAWPSTGTVLAILAPTILAGIALFVLTTGLVGPTGWRARPSGAALGATVALVLGAALVPALAADPPDHSEMKKAGERTVGDLEVAISAEDQPDPAAKRGGTLHRLVAVYGPANRTVDVAIEDVGGPNIEITSIQPQSATLTLEELERTPGRGSDFFEVAFTYELLGPDASPVMTFELKVDGEPVTISDSASFFDYNVSMPGASIASLLSAGLPVIAGTIFARRWDAWT
jgi:ABC-type transport system involved in multi-copper enzyme maturation permease subunit